jgi:Ser-tRNA(Ala) deacylase AlaX
MKEDAKTRELFLDDAYLREFDARVRRIAGREVWLEHTAFYPGGSGQPHDKGTLGVGPVEARVVDVQRRDGEIVHVTDNPIPETVGHLVGVLDWERRYAHMRNHTALHVLSAVLRREFGAEVSGGKVYPDRARVDLSLPDSGLEWTADLATEIERSANLELAKEHPVSTHEPPSGEPGIEVRADGGIHVANTREVGRISIKSHESKGRAGSARERIEFVLEPR